MRPASLENLPMLCLTGDEGLEPARQRTTNRSATSSNCVYFAFLYVLVYCFPSPAAAFGGGGAGENTT